MSLLPQNGEFIDLCRGPHVPYSTMIQAFAATRNSATNWLAKTENDTLQRIYGVSFPDKKELKKWQEFQEQVRESSLFASAYYHWTADC